MAQKDFRSAIVRKPGKSMVEGISTAGLGVPDYQLALVQHTNYVDALESCGVEVVVLEANEAYPDSTFVEDTAVLATECAVITRPGAPSRRGEITEMRDVLSEFFANVEEISPPGSLEGGDVMRVGSHFYVGLSERTNLNGAQQLFGFLAPYGYTGSVVEVEDMLHLKTGISYIENNSMVMSKDYLNVKAFHSFQHLLIEGDEAYAANCIWVNGTVLLAKGYPKARKTISDAGYKIIEVGVSEYKKLDGGLSCLSLRF